MREIKYRQPIFDSRGNFYSWHYWGFFKAGQFIGPTSDSIHWDKNQQFTGLLDKNSKEIYEGDILNWESATSYVVVEWEDGGYRVKLNGNWENLFARRMRHMSIIGNIYESPELLEAA